MDILLSIYVFLFGIIIGSFLNCLIWRLHEEESITGRSYCPKCRKQIAWYDNIPIISFILLRGKCRHCGKKISWQYPIVEFIIGVLFVLAWRLNYGSAFLVNNGDISSIIHNSVFIIKVIRDFFLISVFTIIFIIDLRWYLILDIVTLPACIIVLALNIAIGYGQCTRGAVFSWSCLPWPNLLFAGIVGGSFFLLQYAVSKGKWIGGGDIRLGLLMGLALGWPTILLAIMLAYVIGSIVGVSLIWSGKKKWGSQIPLGIFLSTASVISLFWGKEIIAWYLKHLGV